MQRLDLYPAFLAHGGRFARDMMKLPVNSIHFL
jgi:hypothetical protein